MMRNMQLSWQEMMDKVCVSVEEDGYFKSDDYEMSRNDYELRVRDVETGFLVAFSSMQADYGSSLEEFAADYFVD